MIEKTSTKVHEVMFLICKNMYILKVYSTNYTLIRFLYDLKRKVCLSKIMCGIFHFRFCFAFIKVYIFVQQNA